MYLDMNSTWYKQHIKHSNKWIYVYTKIISMHNNQYDVWTKKLLEANRIMQAKQGKGTR